MIVTSPGSVGPSIGIQVCTWEWSTGPACVVLGGSGGCYAQVYRYTWEWCTGPASVVGGVGLSLLHLGQVGHWLDRNLSCTLIFQVCWGAGISAHVLPLQHVRHGWGMWAAVQVFNSRYVQLSPILPFPVFVTARARTARWRGGGMLSAIIFSRIDTCAIRFYIVLTSY